MLDPTFSDWKVKAVAVTVTIAATGLNIVGVKSAAKLQNALVAGLIMVLVFYLVMAVPHVDPDNLRTPLRQGWGGLAMATGTAFVAFGGLTKAAAMAEEVEDPGRILPLAMFLAFGIVTLLYVSVVMVTVGVMGDAMSGDLNPIAHGAELAFGRPGLVLLSAAALTAYITTGNAGIMAASRMPMAMSRDSLLPQHLSRVHTDYGTPTWSLGLTSAFMVAAIVFLDLETLIKTASVMKILLFLLVNVAVIVMRESRVEFYRPTVRVPLYPVVPVFGIVAYALLSLKMGLQPLLLALGYLAAGLLWFALYARVRVNRESAVLHAVGRVAEEEGSDVIGLEAELRGILRDRDGYERDEFAELVEEALVEDLGTDKDLATLSNVADLIGTRLGPRVEMPPKELSDLVLVREFKTTSVMAPGVAAILIKAPGHEQAELMLLRSQAGIHWHGSNTPVHAVVVLATSRDHRHQRLRMLTGLAQIVNDPAFARRWMRVRDKESLRELLLMGARHRDGDDNPFLIDA